MSFGTGVKKDRMLTHGLYQDSFAHYVTLTDWDAQRLNVCIMQWSYVVRDASFWNSDAAPTVALLKFEAPSYPWPTHLDKSSEWVSEWVEFNAPLDTI